MLEAQDVDMDNGGDCHKEVEERHSPLKSESSQPKRKSPLRTCKKEIVDDETDTGSQPRQGSMGGVPTANGSETKIRSKGHLQVFIDGLEPRFKKLCEQGLCLDEKTAAQALQLFRESKPLLLANIGTIGTGTVEETERLWSACVLYVLRRLSNGGSAGGDRDDNQGDKLDIDCPAGFTLSQLLRETKLSVVEFFKELPQFLAKAGPILKTPYGDDWERRLQVKEVQANFVHLMVLFNYYKRLYQELFIFPETPSRSANGSSSGGSGDPPLPVHMRFGWMLFLALRMHILSHFTDLVTCTNGLLAVIIILIIHTPVPLRRFSFDDKTKFAKRTPDGVNLVGSLCLMYHASEEDVVRMVEELNRMIKDLLKNPSKEGTACDAQQVHGINLDGITHFEGLMEDEALTSHLLIMEKDYDEWYHSRGELDERMFINGEDSLIGAVSSGGTPSVSGVKRKHDSISSPVHGPAVSSGASPSSPCHSPCSSPVRPGGSLAANSSKPPPTPVSVTMTTAKWLRTMIAPLPAEPSPELQGFFQSCDRNIAADVKYRANVLLESIFRIGNWRGDGDAGAIDSTWAEQRRLEALKLYYKVLGSMCKAEFQRLRCKNLLFLPNERFHRCMIACSAELVLATHKTVTMTFPAVLEPTGITAFDLSKVIESFVRHEELPRELKRHLNSIEERLLESMAWERGSSMYNSLIIAKPNLASEINRMNLMAEPMPSLDNLSLQHNSSSASRLAAPCKMEGAEGDLAGGPLSPARHVSATPVKANGNATGVDQAGPASFMSPVRGPSAFTAFNSPQRSRLVPPLLPAFASPQRPNPHAGGETCAETCINVFFQKVMKLAAVRIRNLCDRLQQSHQIAEQVYRVVQHALHHETSLFFNRHIDQLILCSLYGICKVSKVNVTFRDIIFHYRKQPQCKPYVFRNVFIDLPPVRRAGKPGGQETGDIIKFYNEVFVPSTKSFLLNAGSNASPAVPSHPRVAEERDQGDVQAPGSPRPSSFPILPDMSPKKVSASHNVYVSPLPSNKVDSIMSPHTRSLYACVGESTQAYQSPSKDLTAINNRLNHRTGRRLGRLDFGDAALVSDTLVANVLHPLNGNGSQQGTRVAADPAIAPKSWSASKRPRSDR